ncbi:L-lysine 6-transaminase [bacterium]|nr:L-lysine 6-transaminase [bacterium]MBU1638097.1 L-lysine 6-transaminase [bacterium]
MSTINAKNVHETLSKYMHADGFDLVFDMEKSKGTHIYDKRYDREFLDLFSFFASCPLGHNHPKMMTPELIQKFGKIAMHNITNSDLYTEEMAEFVDTFFKIAVPQEFKYSFYVAGGALGVENAVKAAMDWKVRKNLQKGYRYEVGTQVMHFEQCFHGRTGYTLSMTNTADPNKTKYFAKFDWPRIINPKIKFPLTEGHLEEVEKLERLAVAQIEVALAENPDDICALIIEPIQGEGGDNHFRSEFMRELRRLADEHDFMLIFDEVQSGIGLTGKMWAHQHFGMSPDMIAFGKKTQVCGFLCTDRIDEVPDNVFHVGSRINSTWGGNLIDMVRFSHYLKIIQEDKLVENAAAVGKRALSSLQKLGDEFPKLISNVRGRGLMCAFDLPTTEIRNEMVKNLYTNGVAILGCGTHTIRYRPALIFSEADVAAGEVKLREVAEAMTGSVEKQLA